MERHDGIKLPYNRDIWLSHEKMVRNFVFHQMCGICCLPEEPLGFREGFSTLELVS